MTRLNVGAAPHLPAGILSPYSDGERGAVIAGFANHRRCKRDAGVAASLLLPARLPLLPLWEKVAERSSVG